VGVLEDMHLRTVKRLEGCDFREDNGCSFREAKILKKQNPTVS